MAKKNKTPTQLKKSYKRLSHTFFGLEFVSTLAPFVTIAIVNYNSYFVEYDGTKMTIACFLSAALCGIAIWLVAKKKYEGTFITLILGWACVWFIFLLLGKVINDIAMIMGWGLLGLLGAYGCDIASKKFESKAERVKKNIEKAQDDAQVEAYKEEVRQEEIKKENKVK